jgi:type I restriction enzyme S subunit
LFSGETWRQDSNLFDSDYFPYLEISAVGIGTNEYQLEDVKVESAPSRARMVLRENDIVVSTTRPHRGAIAKIKAEQTPFIGSTGFAVIRNIIDESFDSTYLLNTLFSELVLKQFFRRSSGGSYPAITLDELCLVKIPKPPLPIQEKLVEEMERARESRRRKLAESESVISQANEAFQNQLGISLPTNTTKSKTFALKLNQLQGKRLDVNFHNPSNDKVQSSLYENRPLKSLVTLLSGGTPSKSEAEFWNGNIPWVSPKDFKEFYLNDAEDHISEKGVKDAGLKLIPKHSVLMVVRSGVLIHSLPVAFNLEPVTINQDLKALITNDDINAEYLAFYLRVLGKRLLPSITKHSTTVQSVNTGEFESLQIPVPPLPTQQKLVDELKHILETSRRLKSEAESEWQAAKDWFEAQLLGK